MNSIKTAILAIVLVLITTGVAAQAQRFEMDINFYDNNTSAEIKEVNLINSRQITPLSNDIGNYRFLVESNEGKTLFEGRKTVSFSLVGPPGPNSDTGVRINQDIQKTTLYLNYSKHSRYFKIYEEGEKVLQIDLAEEVCGNNSGCTEYCEYHNRLPDRCKAEQEDKEKINQTENKSISSEARNIFIIFVLIIAGVLAWVTQRRRLADNG